VNLFLWVLTEVDKNVEEFFNVGHVEVSGHHEIAASPVVLTEKGMHVFNAVESVRSIPEMAQPQFAGEGYVLLEPAFISELLLSRFLRFPVFLTYFLKEIRYRLTFNGPVSADVSVTRFYVDFDV